MTNCLSELTYSIYADGELSADEACRVEVHLASCARCRALLDALRVENRLLSELLQGELEEPAIIRAASPFGILRMLLVMLAAAGGLRLAASWLEGFRLPAGADWLNPFTPAFQWNLVFSSLFYLVEEGISMFVSLTNTIGALLVGLLVFTGSLFLLRTRPAKISAVLTLMLAFGLSLPVYALERRTGQTVTVPEGQTVDDTLLACGENVIIDGIVTGDVIAAGRRVVINGTVKGNLLCSGQTVDVEGTVGGSVFGFAQSVNIRGQVARNAFGFGQFVQLPSLGRVDADLFVFCSTAHLDGNVGRDVLAFGESTDVRGNIGRNLEARVARLTLLAPARVGGDLTAYVSSKSNVHIDPGSTIGGKTETRLRGPKANRYARLSFYLWQAIHLVAALLTGLLLVWLFPSIFAARLDTGGALLRTAGVGFLILIATPVAAILAGITLIGLPIALVVLALWLLGLYLAKILVAATIGQLIMRPPNGQIRRFAPALLAGLAIVFVAINIPYIGGIIHFLVILPGLGMAFWQARAGWQSSGL